jgi:hypothetical protein
VRINDRGPFVHGRVIDLSPAAAKALKVNGLAPVSLIVESGVDDEQNGKLAYGANERPPQSATDPVQVVEKSEQAGPRFRASGSRAGSLTHSAYTDSATLRADGFAFTAGLSYSLHLRLWLSALRSFRQEHRRQTLPRFHDATIRTGAIVSPACCTVAAASTYIRSSAITLALHVVSPGDGRTKPAAAR